MMRGLPGRRRRQVTRLNMTVHQIMFTSDRDALPPLQKRKSAPIGRGSVQDMVPRRRARCHLARVLTWLGREGKHSPLVRRVIGVGQRAAGWWWSAYQRELQTGAMARKVSWIRSTRELDSRSLLRSAVKPAWSFSL
jgi:hypothetical protein